jgi:hypothetical protein
VTKVSDAKPGEVSRADLVLIGGWVQGLFIMLQHSSEGAVWFINQLGNLTGKKVAVFCTYKIAVGSTLRKLSDELEFKGAEVVGRFKFRGPKPNAAFEDFLEKFS